MLETRYSRPIVTNGLVAAPRAARARGTRGPRRGTSCARRGPRACGPGLEVQDSCGLFWKFWCSHSPAGPEVDRKGAREAPRECNEEGINRRGLAFHGPNSATPPPQGP